MIVSGKWVGGEKKEVSIPDLSDLIASYVEQHSAGSPTDESIKWSYLQPCEIQDHLLSVHGHQVSLGCIKRILKAQGWRKRKPPKILPTGQSSDRKAQFKIICELIALFEQMDNNPIISIDTKKKELLGDLTRNQPILCRGGQAPAVYDHDYPYLASGKGIPHGIFDYKNNQGYISIGNSHETADFILDNLAWWWDEYGINHYPDATAILILCDSGGANGHRHYRFRKRLQDWAKEIGIKLIIAHYPPYCSKYNPIERMLFCHLQRTIKNMILTSLKQLQQRFQQAKTKTGLKVVVRIVDQFFPLKQPSNKEMIDNNRICYNPKIPRLSYAICP